MKLTPEQIAFYELNGYVIVRELFQQEEVNTIKNVASKIADETKQFSTASPGDTFNDLRGTSVVLTTNSKSDQVIKRIVWAAAADPKLLTFGRNKRILTPVSQLLGSESEALAEADHLINQIHYKTPGDEVAFPWHQDEQNRRFFDPEWEDINKKGSFVQTLAAIDNCTEDNGPLYVIPGSHRLGFLKFKGFLQSDELQTEVATKGIDVKSTQVPLLMNAGDVVFMHPHLIHGSWPNNSNEPRRMFINGFSYPGANHKPYPGKGSAKRISLVTGKELDCTSEQKVENATHTSAVVLTSASSFPLFDASRLTPKAGVTVTSQIDDQLTPVPHR